jgi:hypothetical protein
MRVRTERTLGLILHVEPGATCVPGGKLSVRDSVMLLFARVRQRHKRYVQSLFKICAGLVFTVQ